MKGQWWIIGLLALVGLIITTLIFLEVVERKKQRDCEERGGKVIKIQGAYSRGQWLCDE